MLSAPYAAAALLMDALPASPDDATASLDLHRSCGTVWRQAWAQFRSRIEHGSAYGGHYYHFKWGFPGEERGGVEPQGVFHPWNNSVAFLHVGKAGGGTIGLSLKRSQIPHDELHMAPADCGTPDSMLLQHTVFVVGVRGPVDRFVSAYNWAGLEGTSSASAYQVCGTVDSVFNSDPGDDAGGAGQPLAFNCSRFRELVLAQSSSAAGAYSVAEATALSHKHLFRGYCFHLGGCFAALRGREVIAIPTETMNASLFAQLPELHSRFATHGRPMMRGNPHASEGSKYLSKSARRALELALADEYWLVNSILRLSRSTQAYCTQEAKIPGVCHVGAVD